MGYRLHAGGCRHRVCVASLWVANAVSGRDSAGIAYHLDPAQSGRAGDLDQAHRERRLARSLPPTLASTYRNRHLARNINFVCLLGPVHMASGFFVGSEISRRCGVERAEDQRMDLRHAVWRTARLLVLRLAGGSLW